MGAAVARLVVVAIPAAVSQGAAEPVLPQGQDREPGAYVFGLFGTGCTSSAHLQAALLAAVHTLAQAGPSFPIVSMLGDGCASNIWLRKQLQSLQSRIVDVEEIHDIPCRGPRAQQGRLQPTYTMSAIWSLTAFDVVFYLDSDLAVIQPLDHVIREIWSNGELQEARTPMACRSATSSLRGPFNTGVWAVRPNRSVFDEFVTYMRGNTDGKRFGCGIGFQEAAVAYFSRPELLRNPTWRKSVVALHVGYNLKPDQFSSKCLKKANLTEAETYVVHWSGKRKPQRTNSKDFWFEAWPVKLGLLTYQSKYCHTLAQLDPGAHACTAACGLSRWTGFKSMIDSPKNKHGPSDWARWLKLGRDHPMRVCAAASNLGACLGVPAARKTPGESPTYAPSRAAKSWSEGHSMGANAPVHIGSATAPCCDSSYKLVDGPERIACHRIAQSPNGTKWCKDPDAAICDVACGRCKVCANQHRQFHEYAVYYATAAHALGWVCTPSSGPMRLQLPQ